MRADNLRDLPLSRVDELAALATIATAVSRSLDLKSVLDVSLTTVMQIMGVHDGAVYLLDDDRKLRIKVHQRLTRDYLDEKSTVEMGDGCCGTAASTAEIYAAVDHPESEYVCADSERLLGLDCLVAVPLIAKGEVLGVLELFAPTSRRLTEREANVLTAVGAQIGFAVANAKLFAESQATVAELQDVQAALEATNRKLESHLLEESYIAQTLQESLLPPAVPETEDLDVGTYYGSATRRASIGGDFYDFLPISKGKHAFLVGDVCGKGIEVTSQAAALKYSLRSNLEISRGVSQILAASNRTLTEQKLLDAFATAFLAIVSPKSGWLEYGSAGHPPALIYRAATGTVDMLEAVDPPLGIIPSGLFRRFSTRLQPEDVLLIYTDGLTEARGARGMMFGYTRLVDSLKQAAGHPAQKLVEAVLKDCLDFTGGELQDDVAAVAIKRPPLKKSGLFASSG